jgi:hypothetical protein
MQSEKGKNHHQLGVISVEPVLHDQGRLFIHAMAAMRMANCFSQIRLPLYKEIFDTPRETYWAFRGLVPALQRGSAIHGFLRWRPQASEGISSATTQMEDSFGRLKLGVQSDSRELA